jgi:hypothetical protein
MDTSVALPVVQLRVEDCPAVSVEGSTLNFAQGAAGAGGGGGGGGATLGFFLQPPAASINVSTNAMIKNHLQLRSCCMIFLPVNKVNFLLFELVIADEKTSQCNKTLITPFPYPGPAPRASALPGAQEPSLVLAS